MAAFPRGSLRSWCRGHCRRKACLLSSCQGPKLRSLIRGKETPGQRAPGCPLHLPPSNSSQRPKHEWPLVCVAGGQRGANGGPWTVVAGLEPGSALPAGCLDSCFPSQQPWSSPDPHRSVLVSALLCAPCQGPPFCLHNINNKLIITIMSSLAVCQHPAKLIPVIKSLNLHDDPTEQNLSWGV